MHGLKAVRIVGISCHGHLAVATVELLLTAPRFQYVVRRAHLLQPGPQLLQTGCEAAGRFRTTARRQEAQRPN